MDLEEIISNGDRDELTDIISKYFFKHFDIFFNHLIDEGIISGEHLDDSMIDLLPNEYFDFWIKEKSIKDVLNFFAEQLPDVKYENNKYYLMLSEIGDLSDLFSSSRNSASEEFIRNILEGNLDYGFYYENYESSIIDDLSNDNFKKLIEIIKENGLNKELYYNGSSGVILDFIESDNDDNTFILTTDRLNKIVESKEIYDLIKNCDEFNDLKVDLNSLYNQAYESALSDEYYSLVTNVIRKFLLLSRDEPLYENFTKTKTLKNGEKVNNYEYGVNITNVFDNMVKDSISSYLGKMEDSNELLDYHGRLDTFIKDTYEGLRVYLDNTSPSWSEVVSNYNEYFKDNI